MPRTSPFPFLASVGMALLSQAAAADDPFAPIRQTIERRLAEEQIPSLAVAVSRHGEILWEQGFGWADREARRQADEHTPYSLASISKPFTATALMVLVERGAIDLDRPADDYLGAARLTAHLGSAAEATLRRLANHTAGLPLHYQFFYADEDFARPPREETIRRYGHLVSPPGETFRYANLGYGLLDDVIARASGQSYADFLRTEVFLPLGMTRASVDIGPGLEPYRAVRYGSDQLPLPFYDFDHPGGSAVFCSAHDLLRFGEFHLKQRHDDARQILGDAAIDAMQQPTATVGGAIGYGVGWFVDSDEHGVATVGHSGGMGGVRTRLVLVPSEGIAVATLCNASSDLPMRTAEDILAALLPVYRERLTAARNRPGGAESNAAVFAPPPELLGTWQGRIATYEREIPTELTVQPDGDVHVELAGQLRTLLSEPSWSDGYLRGVLAGDIGTADANRRPYRLHVELKLRDGSSLNGSVSAISLDAPRVGNALSHWMELTKQGE